MADMTLKEVIEQFKEHCRMSIRYGYGEYFCGATNNLSRRIREHKITGVLYSVEAHHKESAQDLLIALKQSGFDTGNSIGSGQDDSLTVYVYKKGASTEQYLEGQSSITFDDTWYNEECIEMLPSDEGIYACFACEKQTRDGHYVPRRLVYIGMTDKQGFKTRIKQHYDTDHKEWAKQEWYNPDEEQLVYAIALKDTDILQTIESALISHHKPIANKEYKYHYQGEYDKMTVTCSGARGSISSVVVASTN